MLKFVKLLFVVVGLILTSNAFADTTIAVNLTTKDGEGQAIGTITVSQTKYGLLFTPNLHGLPPGLHGFHLHQDPNCNDNGMAAGGHLDPEHSGKHLGPYAGGHLGDLPALYVDGNGNATTPVLAPRLKSLKEIGGHAIMIHAGGDNYSDTPEKLGGGGARIACGVITK